MRPGTAGRTINPVKCPKCDGANLMPLEVGEIMLDRCERCAGIWFDHGELEAVVGISAAAHQDAAPESDGDASSGLCPRCLVDMRPAQAVGDPSRPVRVDRCPSCMGLWLDRSRVAEARLSVRKRFRQMHRTR